MDAQYTLTTFTPGEAERITGLTTVMQRDWRRRGFLPATEGHARFDAFAIAETWALKLLTDRGIGPQVAKEIAPWCAAGIAWHALQWVNAYEGDHHRTFEWQPEQVRVKRDPDPDLLEMLKRAAEIDPRVTIPDDFSWGEKARWLAKQIFRFKGLPKVIPARYFIWWADGTDLFHEDLNEAFSGVSSDPRYAGPVIVLDLVALGSTLLDRAGRALVHVEFPANFNTGEIEQPLEYGTPVPFSFNPKNGDSE